MTGKNTSKFLRTYEQTASPTMFFSDMFSSPSSNFFNSEEVEFDVLRSDEEVAIVITDLSSGYRINSEDMYTNKKFKPPVLKEAVPINAYDMLTKEPGDNPFEDRAFRAKLISRVMRSMTTVEMKIRRTMELQASQALQTGKITLTDPDSNVKYEIDFKPKASHFPTAGVSWATATGEQKLADLESMAEVNRNDGLSDSDEIVMGVDTFTNFIQDDAVQKVYDNRRIDLGNIGPMQRRPNGGNFRGRIEIGNYMFNIWTYGGRYIDPVTRVKTQYMAKNKVIMRDSMARMDAVFGAIPNFNSMLNAGRNPIPELPGRMSSQSGRMDLFTNAWTTNDGEHLMAGIGSRPLMIPTAIDTYSCLDTGLPA